MENVRKHRNIKLVTTERRNYLVTEANSHSTKFFTQNLFVMEMRKAQIFMNKSVYLGLLIIDLKKTVIGVIITLNIKVTVIEIKHYQLKNFSIKLDHT